MGRQSRDKRDAYYRLAKEDGYRARAAYKLLQLDASLGLLEAGEIVVDLCAAPGGWSQVAAARTKRVVAVDLKEMAPIAGVERLVGDVTASATVDGILEATAFRKADLVLCDGAPDVYGLADVDDWNQIRLARTAFDVADKVLAEGGTFVTKVYRGLHSDDFFDLLRNNFRSVVCAKPRCSRAASIEAFAVARGFRLSSSSDDSSQIPFVACGRPGVDLDADSSYPLRLFPDYKLRDPVQRPINPTHKAALTEAKKKERDPLYRSNSSSSC